MIDALLRYLLPAAIVAIPLLLYLLRIRKRRVQTMMSLERTKSFSQGPRAQHPKVDISSCIGCASCVRACPEGDVLGIFAGKAMIINGQKCIGHGLCAEACPVGAIQMVLADPSMSDDLPFLTPEHETNLPNLYIAGELGGLALIRNAVDQGRECVDTIAARLRSRKAVRPGSDEYDVCIVGAGPAGISASLRAVENGLRYITLEQGEIGGTVAKYPRQKLVMTSPVEFPLYGRFSKLVLTKEEMIAFWEKIGRRADFAARTGEAVSDIRLEEDNLYRVMTPKGNYRALAVILALGRNGTPRKLEVKGEDLPKVMYRLIEADAYTHKNICIVGGGDSAIEAAMGLADQIGNRVLLSYRRDCFSRLKDRNEKRIREYMGTGRIRVLFNSRVVEIKEEAVILECGAQAQEFRNDLIWVFAGGIPPNDFLQKIGVQFGRQNVADGLSTMPEAPPQPALFF